MQGRYTAPTEVQTVAQISASHATHAIQSNATTTAQVEYFALACFLLLAVAGFGYRKYRASRFRRQIENLERLWLISPSRKVL